MSKVYPGYFLRCPIATIATLSVPVSRKRGDRKYTNDSRAIHMLRCSLFVLIDMRDGYDPNEFSCREYQPSLKMTKKGVRIPNFGYLHHGQIVWISPQAVNAFGKENVMQDIKRAVYEHFAIELRNRTDIMERV